MDKEVKCMIAEGVGEAVVGYTIGKCVGHVMKGCNTFEQIVLGTGSFLIGYTIGKVFGREFYKFCDTAFDTDMTDYIDS